MILRFLCVAPFIPLPRSSSLTLLPFLLPLHHHFTNFQGSGPRYLSSSWLGSLWAGAI